MRPYKHGYWSQTQARWSCHIPFFPRTTMAYFDVGSRTSPITVDDSEDEVYYELYKGSNHSSSSSSLSVNLEKPQPAPFIESASNLN